MNTATFSCPYCSAPLRIRDRAFVDREVGCPECGERIEITLGRDQEPMARKVSPDASLEAGPNQLPPRTVRSKNKRKKKSAETSPEDVSKRPPRLSRKPLFQLGERFTGVPGVLLSPVGVAWTVAGIVGLGLLILAWPAGEPAGAGTPQEQLVDSTEAESFEANPFETDLEDVGPPELPMEMNVDEGAVAARLSRLGIRLKSYAEERGHFPPGSVSAGNQADRARFSWLAEMFAKSSGGRIAEPQWDQPWNDPLNDRFVRQPREPYLNPLISRRVGPDRYPATHFVGVAGVGADAPRLPVDHPRAGIFGIDRKTRSEDIKDGLAHTMMVAGVMNRLGSWAAAGPPTVRAFTQEPYFEGPDGFGTAETQGMSVLMADGSVRFLSKDIAPVIVRRMAAMADGWPLDDTVPGEPGDRPPAESVPIEPPVIAEAKPPPEEITVHKPEQPIEPDPPSAEPEPPEPVDIPAALAVKVVKFDQIKEVPFQQLLYQVEELCGVPIRPASDLPAAEEEFWNRPVSMSLKNASVRQILESLLEKVNLRFTVESDHIQLRAAE
jgi:hypothetical protein